MLPSNIPISRIAAKHSNAVKSDTWIPVGMICRNAVASADTSPRRFIAGSTAQTSSAFNGSSAPTAAAGIPAA